MLAGPAGVAAKDDRAGNRLRADPRRREGRGRRLRLHRRPLAQALARPRRLHEVRQVPRRLSRDGDRLSALTPRPRPRPARGGRGLDGKPRGTRHRPRVPRARADSRHHQVGDALVVHAVHGLRRDLPGRDRACPDHQPDAPRPCREGRHGRPAPADPGDDLHVRELLRRGKPQAWSLGEGSRLQGQGRAQGSGRGPLVRGRLRVLRPAKPEGQPVARAHPQAGRRRLRDPLRRRAHRRQRRAPGRRGGPLRGSRRGERRHDLRLQLRPDPHLGPAQLQHAQERVPAVRRRVGRACTTRSSSSS